MCQTVKIVTTCGVEVGPFWGINDDGYRPECMAEIEEEIEVETLLEYGPGPVWEAPVVVTCPKCGTLLEWPQEWELADGEQLVLPQ